MKEETCVSCLFSRRLILKNHRLTYCKMHHKNIQVTNLIVKTNSMPSGYDLPWFTSLALDFPKANITEQRTRWQVKKLLFHMDCLSSVPVLLLTRWRTRNSRRGNLSLTNAHNGFVQSICMKGQDQMQLGRDGKAVGWHAILISSSTREGKKLRLNPEQGAQAKLAVCAQALFH